jgi:triacylglycerol lipase
MSSYIFQSDITKFDSNTTAYRGENALVLADCAKLAYEPESIIKDALINTWKFKNFEFFSGKSTQAFVAGNDKLIIVAFRGTEIKKIADILADAEMELIPGPAGKVHKGFYHALQEVWGHSVGKDMHAVIKSYLDNKQSVWFCGHSLGAALATLAAAEYAIKEKSSVNGLYTIGQPRTGNADFAKQFDNALPNKSFRFINNNDIVPRVPVPGLILRYTHIGNALYLDSSGKLYDSIPWWQKGWDMLKGTLDDTGKLGPDDIKDHKSANYVSLIQKNRAVSTKWS